MDRPVAGPAQQRILVVDDNLINRRLLSGRLKDAGYVTETASNGEQALAAAQADPPDLILLDIKMPGMDGYELCERLKAEENTSEIPIIFISAVDATQDIVKAFTTGGVDYVTKPFQFEEVLARVETHLSLRHLQQQLQGANRRLARNLRELDTLWNIAESLNQVMDLPEATHKGLETTVSLLGGRAGWVTLEDAAGDPKLAAVCHLPDGLEADIECFTTLPETGISSGPSLVPLPAQFFGDVTDEEKPDIDNPREAGQYISIPLRLGERRLGMLNLVPGPDLLFTESVRRLLKTIGELYSATIERARLFEDVQHLAIVDSLTDMLNRRHFFLLAQKERERSRRYSHPLSVIMLDIDHFKRINDTYGHAAGDQMLVAVARLCQGELRKSDVAGRYGGEEFVMLLVEADQSSAHLVAERLRRKIEALEIQTVAGKITVTASLGIATMPPGSDVSLEELLNQADQALYRSKQTGRNRISFWQDDQSADHLGEEVG